MKAVFIIFICLFFFNIPVFSETEFKTKHEFSYGAEIDLSRKGKIEEFSYAMRYDFTLPEFSTVLGVKTGSDSISTTIHGTYLPLRLKSLSLGVQTLYNANLFTEYCIENNFLLGTRLITGKLNKVLLSLDISYLLKLTDFYKFKNTHLIIDNTLALSLMLESIIKNKVLLSFKISSYGIYAYPLFFTPMFELKTTWFMKHGIRLNSSIAVKYSDMFTLTSYLSNIMMGVSITFKIPNKEA